MHIDEGYEVVCCLANVGQEEDWDAVKRKALKIGAQKMVIEDLQKEFVEDLCFRAVQCNAQVRVSYLVIGVTSRTRRLIRTRSTKDATCLGHRLHVRSLRDVLFERHSMKVAIT